MHKLNKCQRRKVHALVRKRCANCVDNCCLLLDDGEEHTCVQLLSRYGVYCNYFLNAVLPSDRKLYDEIRQSNQNKQLPPQIKTAGETAERNFY